MRTRRTRLNVAPREPETAVLPDELDILFDPWVSEKQNQPQTLPPSDVFEGALHNLHVALHPHTQHQATYPSQTSSRVEPTLALYCPIEGGDYILDATVRELARATDAEVVTLDSVHMAAGEWGMFGKAATAIQLPENPLHFATHQPPSTPPRRSRSRDEREESDGPPSYILGAPQMTFTVMAPPGTQGRAVLTKRTQPPSKLRIFFDTVIDVRSTSPDASSSTSSSSSNTSSSTSRPRIIYVRDYTTLASTSSAWYPELLAAVHQRRKGPTSRPSSPVPNPTVIIFGISPPLMSPNPHIRSPAPPAKTGGRPTPTTHSRKSAIRSPANDWGEDDQAGIAREARMKDRLRKWERGLSALQEEIPGLSTVEGEEEDSGEAPEGIAGLLGGLFGGGSRPSPFRGPPLSASSSYFRTSVVVPETRTAEDEHACRVSRRREINQLTMRMAIGQLGGTTQDLDLASPLLPPDHVFEGEEGHRVEEGAKEALSAIWSDWGRRLESWSSVQKIADNALGNVIGLKGRNWYSNPPTLEPTMVPWSFIWWAWLNQRMTKKVKRAWLKEIDGSDKTAAEDGEGEAAAQEELVDEVIEKIKQDPDLDIHEQRLLPCIVNAVTMQPTFAQVHLPPHTIDSVRTMVSLPLLYPAVFRQGILKEHAMTGCLLFGPPGTGKTLLVKALAKEAGCRMMNVSPSDVMDMYVGEGEKLVKAVFSLARRLSPCVVFLDEIDALFGARMSARDSGGAFAHRGVITEFMQEMDGLKSSKDDNVIVIGATNRPFDLDDAVLRRLPRRLLVDLPGEAERAEILKIMLRDEILSPSVDLQKLARDTASFSGSDLKHLCVSAALNAVKERVVVPWSISGKLGSSSAPKKETETEQATASTFTDNSAETALGTQEAASGEPNDAEAAAIRILRPHNFAQALTEITPTASDSLSALVKKWNDDFGEGRKDRKKQQVWGKGIFGFVDKVKVEDDGRILPESPSGAQEMRR